MTYINQVLKRTTTTSVVIALSLFVLLALGTTAFGQEEGPLFEELTVELCEEEGALNVGEPLPCEHPEPVELCEDDSADNYGEELPCEYPEVPEEFEKVDICHWSRDDGEYKFITPASEGALNGHQKNHELDIIPAPEGGCPKPDPEPEPDPESAKVIAHKIVCDHEEDLPNWGGEKGPNIENNTAADWVANSERHCWFEEGWEFQWAPQGTGDAGDDFYGEAGDPWTTFGPTDGGGMTMTDVTLGDNDSYVWMREVLQEGYIPFTHSSGGDDYSAEMYCHIDSLNYDNYERVDGVEYGETYYCVAWNYTEDQGPEYDRYCGDGELNQRWEQCDSEEGCTDQCQWRRGGDECTDLTLAKVNVHEYENWGSGDMTDDLYVGGLLPIPNNTWFPLFWNGSYFTDSGMLGNYDDVEGLAVERREGGVHTLHYGSHKEGQEHSRGGLSFWSWDGSVVPTGIASDDGQDKIEKPFDGEMKIKAGQDEIWLDGLFSKFWLTVTVADDGYKTRYSEPVQCDDCVDELEGGWVDVVEDSEQGTTKGGGDVAEGRSNPEDATGESDWNSGDGDGFYSLGVEGWVEFSFDKYVPDVEGDDISIHEATNGSYPAETARIEVSQDGEEWYDVGTADNNGVSYFDFSSTGLSWIKYVRVTDTTDYSLHKDNADGFDLDAVDATQELCDQPDDPKPECLVDGYKYDAQNNPLEGWEIGLTGVIGYPTLTTREGGDLEPNLIASDFTDENGYYCIEEDLPQIGKGYEVGEFFPDDDMDWYPVDVKINGDSVDYSTDSFFDVFVGIDFEDLGDVQVDFYNDYENGGGGDDPECSDGVDNEDPEDDLADEYDPGCHTDGDPDNPDSYDPEDDDETDESDNDDNDDEEDRGSISGGRAAPRGGQVLGASCGLWLNDYLHMNFDNNRNQVTKLQIFLAFWGDYDVDITGVFDQKTYDAVRAFQGSFGSEVLNPWASAFAALDNTPSGYVYQTTKWKINNIMCPGIEPFPQPLIMAPGTTI